MVGKSMGLPAGVEFANSSIRVRFYWNGRRYCETTPYPQTAKGIKSATALRAQVVSLIKLGIMDEQRYCELFPSSIQVSRSTSPTLFEYAQDWLDSREIAKGTRKNYLSSLNLYWMPHLARRPVDQITSAELRKLIVKIKWSTPSVKRSAMNRLGAILNTAVLDGMIERNPLASIELPKRLNKDVDPFEQSEVELIIAHLYKEASPFTRIYAAYFEFAMFTGMRPCEIMALRWDEIDEDKRTARICRIVADRQIRERVKNKKVRVVLLNERAMKALAEAKANAEHRATREMQHAHSPYVFPPSKGNEFVNETSVLHKHFKQALIALSLRERPQYNCRHTYATLCLMTGMNPAFIANQLGHSVQMLLSTYARWISSASDWNEISKLGMSEMGTK